MPYSCFAETLMFLVRADDKTQLHSIAESFDAIENFEHFDLGQLNTTALLDLCKESTSWMSFANKTP